MATNPKPYAADKVLVTFLGSVLSGFAKDSLIKASRNGDSFQVYVGADGEVSRARLADKSGTVTIMLAMTSASNDVLSAALAADELGGVGVGPLIVKDASGRTVIAAENAWVKKFAEVEFGQEVTAREWTLETGNLLINVGGAT